MKNVKNVFFTSIGRVGIDGRLSNQVDKACGGSCATEKSVKRLIS